MNIGYTIATLRNKRGYTQRRLAELSNISQAYLSLIESDKKEPTLQTLKDISAALDLPLPILSFLLIDDKDVKPHFKDAFARFQPLLTDLIEESFLNGK